MREQQFTEKRTAWGAQQVYDLIGVGFGPANLSLAITIDELAGANGSPPLASLFLERQQSFAWHPDMLMDGTRLQVSFLKDLVTLRNPQSPYTFLSYIFDKGRLSEFMTLRQFFPTRIEYNDYYTWAAKKLEQYVAYGRQVESVNPIVEDDGRVERLEVRSRNVVTGAEESYQARNLVVATGGVPTVPDGVSVRRDGPVIHSYGFLRLIKDRCPDREKPCRLLVVGSGQSAAEIFRYLYSHYPNAQVTAAIRRYAFKPADASHFISDLFNPEAVDFLYGLPEQERGDLIREHYDTNYSAVDRKLIHTIYEELYDRRAAGNQLASVRQLLELERTEETDNGVVAHFRNRSTGEAEQIEADLIVLATGFVRKRRHPVLDGVAPYLVAKNDESFEIDRSYRIVAKPEFQPNIYLQGFCESTHGLTDTLLSILPARAQDIFDSLSEANIPAVVESAVR